MIPELNKNALTSAIERIKILEAERDAAVAESNRRDQKWMEVIDSIVGRKLRYTLATITDPPGFDLVPDLQDFIADLRTRLQTAEQQLGQVREEVKEEREKLLFHINWYLELTTTRPDGSPVKPLVPANRSSVEIEAAKLSLEKLLFTLSATPSDGCGKGRTDKERLDKLQELANDTPGITVGGVCSWSVYRGEERLGEGDDLREALDDAIENEAASSKGKGGVE